MSDIIGDMLDETAGQLGGVVLWALGGLLCLGIGVFVIPIVIAWQMGRHNKKFWQLDRALILLGVGTGLMWLLFLCVGYIQAYQPDAENTFAESALSLGLMYAVVGAISFAAFKWGRHKYHKLFRDFKERPGRINPNW